MNVLFVTDYSVSPTHGGIERVASGLSAHFEQLGWRCFFACFALHDGDSAGNALILHKRFPSGEFRKFLSEKRIDIIFSHLLQRPHLLWFPPFAKESSENMNVKTVFLYHNMPGYELQFSCNRRFAIHCLKNGFAFRQNLQRLMLSLLPGFVRNFFAYFIAGKYRIPYRDSDVVVLLSESYKKTFARLAGVSGAENKFAIVPNALPFSLPKVGFSQKKKSVLIVSRLDDGQKRVSDALEIWRMVEEKFACADWRLKIVGGGNDASALRSYAEHLHLRRVEFCGRCPSEGYYAEASVLMMTSAYEGFPMVLVEALQHGVVPVAFGSFGAVSDVLEDGRNGIVVPSGSRRDYAERLSSLLQNAELRQRMAEAGIRSCESFRQSEIFPKWERLFADLKENDKKKTYGQEI